MKKKSIIPTDMQIIKSIITNFSANYFLVAKIDKDGHLIMYPERKEMMDVFFENPAAVKTKKIISIHQCLGNTPNKELLEDCIADVIITIKNKHNNFIF